VAEEVTSLLALAVLVGVVLAVSVASLRREPQILVVGEEALKVLGLLPAEPAAPA